jgi:hypothetical protein
VKAPRFDDAVQASLVLEVCLPRVAGLVLVHPPFELPVMEVVGQLVSDGRFDLLIRSGRYPRRVEDEDAFAAPHEGRVAAAHRVRQGRHQGERRADAEILPPLAESVLDAPRQGPPDARDDPGEAAGLPAVGGVIQGDPVFVGLEPER